MYLHPYNHTKPVVKKPCVVCDTIGKYDHGQYQFHAILNGAAKTWLMWSCHGCYVRYSRIVSRAGYPRVDTVYELLDIIDAEVVDGYAQFDCLLRAANMCELGECYDVLAGNRWGLPRDIARIIGCMVPTAVVELPPRGAYPNNPRRLCRWCYGVVIRDNRM